MSGTKRKFSKRKAGSRILVQIVALIAIVFIALGIISFFFFNGSQSRMIHKSMDMLVENKAAQMCSTNRYYTRLMTAILLLSLPGSTPQALREDFYGSISLRTASETQQLVNEMLGVLVDDGLFNSSLALIAMPSAAGVTSEPLIVMSSNHDTIYHQLPEELAGLAEMSEKDNDQYRTRLDDNNSYMLSLNGVPGLGLEGEYLITAYRYGYEGSGGDLWYYNFSSMHDELAAIDKFYREERRKINFVLLVVMSFSTVGIIIITSLALKQLVRKKITRPIDELSEAAEKVMDGDLDAEVQIHSGEEFERLKRAFNSMLSSLRRILYSHDGHDGRQQPGEQWCEKTGESIAEAGKEARKKNVSSMLFRITTIVVTLFIISSGLSLLFFQQSQAELFEKSREQIVRSTAEAVSSGHYYMASLIERYFVLRIPDITSAESMKLFLYSVANRITNPVQLELNSALKDIVKERFQNLVMAIEAVPPISGINEKPLLFLSTRDRFIFEDLPEKFTGLFEMTADDNSSYRARIDDFNSYMLLDEGVPEFSLDGPYLVMSFRQTFSFPTEQVLWFFDFKPMGEQLAEIDSLYLEESKTTLIALSIVLSISILAVLIITVFVLNLLIRIRITGPIKELERSVEEVMEGNLDVEIPVNSGEEFEGLKTAFGEMLRNLRELLNRSTGC
ncbi:MAG: HAMP domain-containing protein [Actinobacteria bacterium]|nr:HAMP domain-containing protein [Actinomycetota bacterium]